MQRSWRVTIALTVVGLAAVMLATPLYAPLASAVNETRQGETIVFTVGGQDQMKTLNWLPAIANDVWTSDVLGRVYDTVGQTHPVTDALVPYIIKGVDDNGDGRFGQAEKGDFLKAPCPAPCPDEVAWRRNITAYYDFNGVFFHDGRQATIGDVFFNYVLQSLNPRFNTDMRVLWDDPNAASLPASRKLNVYHVWCNPTDAQWEGAPGMLGSNQLRCAVRFLLQDDFALFYRSTLAGLTLFPRHVYEQTGGRRAGQTVDRHADWGRAIYPESDPRFGQGIPTDETTYKPFDYTAAEAWTPGPDPQQMKDADVIGTGPFKFATWSFGAFARVDKNPNFFWGVNPANPTEVYDPALPAYIHQPFIDSILYLIYRQTPLGVLALQQGDIDFYHWNLPPDFVPDLLNDPNVRVWSNAEPGFFYVAFNMRRRPFGYTQYPPTDSRTQDEGLPFRRAFANLIDKPTIVRTLLQNYGVIALGVVSPANTIWYNRSLPDYGGYDTGQASLLLDNAGWLDTDSDGWREFPRIGDSQFKILCPQADYDPIRNSACLMIASAAQSIGVNVKAEPTAFGAIINAIDARNFDMFILGWRIGGTDPDYLFSFFHSTNAASGQNYPGFYDSQFDTLISNSRKELDEGKRQQLIKDAQGILAERRPYDVLYYRTNIEAQREDRFQGFTVAAGTIWNYWSLMNIKRPTNLFIRPVVAYDSAIRTGLSRPITVTVRDQDAVAVDGATVKLEVNAGQATFTGGSCTGTETCTGTTAATGTFQATFNAPPGITENTNVEIRVTATSPNPEVAIQARTVVTTIYPPNVQFLSVRNDLSTGDLAPVGETLVFGVEVRDEAGNPANTATVSLIVNPSSASVTPISGSATEMRSNIIFQAPSDIPAESQVFTVGVTATQADYVDGSSTIEFTVVELTTEVVCPDGTVVPAGTPCPRPLIPSLGVLPILAAIGIAAVVYAVMRRRKKGA